MKMKTFLPSAAASWSAEEVQKLRTLASAGVAIESIAKTLNRTPSAVRNKAGLHGIPLARARPQSARVEIEVANA